MLLNMILSMFVVVSTSLNLNCQASIKNLDMKRLTKS